MGRRNRPPDFGIARLSSGEAMTRTGTLVGTIDYMAPGPAALSPAQSFPPPCLRLRSAKGSVWAVDGDLVRLNPRNAAQRSFNMGTGSVSVALDGGVWVAHSGGFLTRFDPRPGHLKRERQHHRGSGAQAGRRGRRRSDDLGHRQPDPVQDLGSEDRRERALVRISG
jgi:hypothetical protein